MALLLATISAYPRALPGSPLGIAWGFLYGYQGVKAETYMPQLRSLGARFTKVYLIWNQIEPEKGRFDWNAVDRFADQLESPDEGLISVFSSSLWATVRASAILPPSPPKNPADYYQFVNTLVHHCRGRVRYWQNDSEPNNPVYWSGTKEQFADSLKLFYRAVKDADPHAIVVAGGYDGLFNPPEMFQFPGQKYGLEFFDYVAAHAPFDAFDLRLYGDLYTIEYRVNYIRRMLAAHGRHEPIVCTEYSGPGFYAFPENLKYLDLVMQWSQSMASGAAAEHPAGNGVAQLYSDRNTLAPQTAMYLQGCPPELRHKLERIQARDLVMRNVLAFAAGVEKTVYWDLWHDASHRGDVMTLMYGNDQLMGYDNGALSRRLPLGDAYARMAGELRGLKSVRRIAVENRPTLWLFEITRHARPPVFVVWERRDLFSGEDHAPVSFEMPWMGTGATTLDALGDREELKAQDNRLRISVGATPIFIE